MSLQIQNLFSEIAPRYDLLNTILSFGTDRRWRRRGVAPLKDRTNVLDLCAGTLALSRELLRINPEVRITALDFSEEMLDWGLKRMNGRERVLTRVPPTGAHFIARRRAPDPSHPFPAIATICADFFQWDTPVESFDGVMCSYGMRNLDDNPAALKKIYNLLKPGGRLMVLEFFRPDRWYTRVWNSTYAQFVIPLIGRFISRHDGAYRHLRDSVRGFYTLDQYAGLLQETGFEVKVAKRMTGGISGLIVADKL